jgi:pimeloyl-ACP methyl ester carboxylesterase
MPEVPETQYTKSGDVHIAYQVLGSGPLDVVFVPGFVSHLEHQWDSPRWAHMMHRLASFSRLIMFDKPGTGLSDRFAAIPTLEQRMDDVRAVLDAAGSERAAVVGASEGGNLSIVFAATHPERVHALVLVGVYAKRLWSPDYPWAPTPEQREQDTQLIEREWAGEMDVSQLAPSAAADPALMRRITTFFRRSASPGAAVALNRMNAEIDTRSVLPTIRVPTLVLQRAGDREVKAEEERWIASQIPDAKYVEVAGDDHLPWLGDSDTLLDEVEEFLTGIRSSPDPDRILATVLFTDIVGSTERAAALGDRRWRELLAAHRATVRHQLEHWRGQEIDTTGDGFLASFDGPARAIRSACAIRDQVRALGLEIRAGVHTGECERVGAKLEGLAVHTGARVAALAGPSEVLVSRTVKDLVAGSGIEFESRGVHVLKGVPGEWQLFSVA